MGKEEQLPLDLEALRATTGEDRALLRFLVLAFIDRVERSLKRLAESAVDREGYDWGPVVDELGGVCAGIHARQLAEICNGVKNLGDDDDSSSRIRAYVQIKDAYDAFVVFAREAGLLAVQTQEGKSSLP